MNNTCRHCKKPIKLVRGAWSSRWWTHDLDRPELDQNQYTDEHRQCAEGGSVALPLTLCWWHKNNGDSCDKKIKIEDIESEDFACGVHMSNFQREKERMASVARAAEMRREQEEMAQWELGVYQAAFDRLVELDPEVFGGNTYQRPEARYGGYRFSKTIEIDILDLERMLSGADKTPVDG